MMGADFNHSIATYIEEMPNMFCRSELVREGIFRADFVSVSPTGWLLQKIGAVLANTRAHLLW